MKVIILLIMVMVVSSICSQILKKDTYKLMQNQQEDSEYFLGNAIQNKNLMEV